MDENKIHRPTLFGTISVVAAIIAFGYYIDKLNDSERRNHIPYAKKMRLIDKKTVDRQPGWGDHFLDEVGFASRTCSQLSFDTDGDMNTTEAIAFPVFYDGVKETELLKVGEEKTLKEWDDTFAQASQQVYDTHKRKQAAKPWYRRDYAPSPDNQVHYLMYKKIDVRPR